MNRRAYIDAASRETILLSWDTGRDGWVPDMTIMMGWRDGSVRLYRPRRTITAEFITMPGGDRWPLIDEQDTRDIRALLVHPWIPDGAAVETIREDNIAEFDAWCQETNPPPTPRIRTPPHPHPHPSIWETAIRPTLDWHHPLEEFVLPPPPPANDLLTLALTASLLSAAAAPQSQPQASAPPALPRMPAHITPLVVQHAIANAATCPITMEPITPTNAAVTACGHVFSAAALSHWLQTHSTCPECRQPTGM